MKKYKITLQGCDDSTYIPIELDEKDYELLTKLSIKSREISSYGCMPIMRIEEIDNNTYWDMVTEEGF